MALAQLLQVWRTWEQWVQRTSAVRRSQGDRSLLPRVLRAAVGLFELT